MHSVASSKDEETLNLGKAEGGSEAPRGRGRPKVMSDEAQSAIILQKARELFQESGYARTTMDEVAARCRISKRTLYRLFPSKTELFAAIIDAHRETMLALPGDYEKMSLQDALEAIFRIDISEEADRERIALLRFVMVESRHYPELHDLARQRGGERSRALLGEWFDKQRQLGRIDVDDAMSAGKILMDMIFGAIVFKTPGDLELGGGDDRKSYLRRCIRIFLNGVRPR